MLNILLITLKMLELTPMPKDGEMVKQYVE